MIYIIYAKTYYGKRIGVMHAGHYNTLYLTNMMNWIIVGFLKRDLREVNFRAGKMVNTSGRIVKLSCCYCSNFGLMLWLMYATRIR